MKPETNLTRSMIWDMECKKALDPSTYVPYVISEAGFLLFAYVDADMGFVRWPSTVIVLESEKIVWTSVRLSGQYFFPDDKLFANLVIGFLS